MRTGLVNAVLWKNLKPEDQRSCNVRLRPKPELSNFQAFFPAGKPDLFCKKKLKVIQGSLSSLFGSREVYLPIYRHGSHFGRYLVPEKNI